MELTWFGHSCFQLRGKNATLITDPYTPQPDASLEVPSPLSKLNATIITVSHDDPGHNYTVGVGGKPRIIHGPGEYEISDVLITGVASYQDHKGRQGGHKNTIYIIHMDDLVICHLGNLGHNLQEEQLEEVADADVLLLPIGGPQTINATLAAEIIGQVEPRVVVPMHYLPAVPGDNSIPSALSTFYKEMGIEVANIQPKFVVTKNSLPAEMQVVLLSSRGQQ